MKNEKTDITKGQKRKKIYEAVKTVLICVLCASSIFMAYKVIDMHSNSGAGGTSFWFTGRDPERIISSELTSENILKTFLDFSKPELVIVNRGENRGELKEENDSYGKTMDFINKVMQGIHSSGAEYSRVPREGVLKNLMMANSVYVKYPYERISETDAKFFQMKNSGLAKNTAKYSEAFLLPDTLSKRVVVYITLKENPTEMLKIRTESFADTLTELINSLEYITTKDYAFAAELNMDKETGGKGTILDSMIAIPLNNKISSTVWSELPREYDNALKFTETTDFSAGLMDIFNYNPNTIRQYVAQDGTLTFVSGTGTLSMHTDGMLEYKALDSSEGVVLSSDTSAKSGDLYESTTGVIKTVKKVRSICYFGAENTQNDIRFTKITPLENGDIRFCMDYFVNGSRVKMKNGCAIEAKVSGGVLTELKMHIAIFKNTDNKTENKPLIGAIDEFYAKGGQNKRITAAALIYEFSDVGSEMGTSWEIRSE